MPRTLYRADANQEAIVAALRAAGCSVSLIQGVREAGIPDLLVGLRGTTYLLEVKRPKGGRLSPSQKDWAVLWRGGPTCVVRTVEGALAAVGMEPF
jgi:hypothetical protein